MSTLQKSIGYGGNARNARNVPTKDIELRFVIPIYEYFIEEEKKDEGAPVIVNRRVIRTDARTVTTTIEAKTYKVDLGSNFITGADRSLYAQFVAGAMATKAIDNFTVGVEVFYLADSRSVIGKQSLELLFFPKSVTGVSMRREASEFMEGVIFVNKDAFVRMYERIGATEAELDPRILLSTISLLTDPTEDQPSIIRELSESVRSEMLDKLTDSGVIDAGKTLSIINKNFESLFDFSLTIPEIKGISIGGKLKILTGGAAKVNEEDFLAYELMAEFKARETGEINILHGRFTAKAPVANALTFSFSEDRVLFREGIDGTITVKVKGRDQSLVWSNEYKPTDPNLAKLLIEVSLQPGTRIVSADTPNVPVESKKLRGQVLELSKKCALKDVVVLIQAKIADNQPWKVVAAAKTDTAGNFTLPYPYGVFTAAQAIISLTPNNPVDVAVTAVRPGNQTIADDFLYLWVRDAECPHEKTGEECDCHSPKKASRLPDYADLIGSDQYSQDIGGACVNLSTPNRTLSEFNYMAIVRTSDPEVANYTLRKVEPPIGEVGTVLNRLAASKATTISLIGVLSGLNREMNVLLNPMDAAVYAASNSVLVSLQETLNSLNAALNPLKTAPVPSLSASLVALNTAAADLDAHNTALNNAISPIETALNAASALADAALTATLRVAGPSQGGWFDFLTRPGNAGVNALFNPFNSAVAVATNNWTSTEAATLRNALNTALTAANSALTAALPTSQRALNAALNAASAVENADAMTRYELSGGTQKIARRSIDLNNPVMWNDAPEPSNFEGGAGELLERRQLRSFAKLRGNAEQSVPSKKNLSFYQAVTVATGHVLHYKSLFKADGYSLGDLLYSLPLGPGQKRRIVVIDSSRTLSGGESQRLSQGESLTASIANERDIITQLSGTITESMRGSSSANTSGVSAGFGTAGQGSGGGQGYGGSGSAVIGVAGGTANSNSVAAQDSSRDVSQFFADKLRQSIMQNAESYRQLNATVITTVQEGQRYEATSEMVANHNHCHALTMMYFEVLRHYAIFSELSSVEECVFVPLLMTNFTTQNIFKWRDVLARSLLPMPSETYLQTTPYAPGEPRPHPLLRAFDAIERIKTQYANVDFPEGSYDDEVIQFIRGSMRIRVALPRPRTRFDRIMSLPIKKVVDTQALSQAVQKFSQDAHSYATKAAFTAGLSTAFQPAPMPPDPLQFEVLKTEAIADAFITMDANYESVPPAQCIRVINFKPQAVMVSGTPLNPISFQTLDFFADNRDDKNQWQAYADILGYQDVGAMLDAYFKGNLISEWDTIFYTDIAPLVFEKLVSRLTLSEFSTDFTSGTKYKGGERAINLSLTGATSKKRNQLPLQLQLGVNDQRFKRLQDYVTLNVEDLTITYSTSHYNGVLFSGNVNDDLLDDTGVSLYIPENNEEKRNPRREDAYLAGKLIEHLNSHLEHYNKALWYNLDPDRRYMLLDGFGIQTYNAQGKPVDEYGQPIPLRSLASIVKNELVTITGNSMVFPVAAGYRVSKDYIIERVADTDGDGEDEVRKVSLLDHYQPLTPIKPYRISVPTKGVFAEAIQGACNACEKIETERLQDWNRFPNPDEPTPISPITPPVPAVTDWKAAFKDFATPIVNIQNAPTTPMPGEGMAALTELLGKSGVFKDITGLEGNQQNVIRTYLSNQENAKAFGEMAKDMAMQQHNTQNSGKIMDSINQAKNSGALSKEDAGKLIKDHLQQQIDGGETKKAELENKRQSTPTPLAKAAVDAVGQGRRVKAQQTDSMGNTDSVDIGKPSPDGPGPGVPIDPSRLQGFKTGDGDGFYSEVTLTPVGYNGATTPASPTLSTPEARAAFQAVVNLVVRNPSSSGDDFFAVVDALKKLDWPDLTSALENLANSGPTLDGMRWLELFYERAKTMVGVDDRVLATTIAVVAAHGGRVIRDADVMNLGRLGQLLLKLSGKDQQKVLERLGIRDEGAEGAMAMISAAAIQAGIIQSPIAKTSSFDFGDWDLPGDMPAPYYIGTSAHLAIAAYYASKHKPPGHFVATNHTSVETIVKKLVSDYDFEPDQIDAKYVSRMPDIFEFSLAHVPPGIVYEIKPWTMAGVAAAEAAMYCGALRQAGIPVVPGARTFDGTQGALPAPNGYFVFESPAPGVIAYQYLRAAQVEIDARDEAKGRKKQRHLDAEALRDAMPGIAAGAAFLAIAAALIELLLELRWVLALAAFV